MRIVYLTIDNVNDNVILAQTLPLLGRLAAFPGVAGVTLYALRKGEGTQYRSAAPPAATVRIAQNRGIWHPLTAFALARFAWAAFREATPETVLIGRNPVSLFCLAPAACRRGTRLVLDYRGILSEEYVLQGKIRARGRVHRLLRGLEGWALDRADAILCVSNRLRRRMRGWRGSAAMKATVIPCCVDPGLPAPEEGAGAAVRTELGWTAQHLVLGYAGSLSAWNRPEAVRNLYRRMRAIDDRTRLLVLTGDGPTAQAIFGAEDGVAVRSVPHAEVPRHLASIDLGLLLRNPSPVNRVASPVKFAEYLWCGAPVLVSAGVGDCTDLVRREGVGFVDEEGLPLTAILAELRARRAELRARCRAVAARRYSAARYDMALGWLLAGRSAATGPTGPPAEEPWA